MLDVCQNTLFIQVRPSLCVLLSVLRGEIIQILILIEAECCGVVVFCTSYVSETYWEGGQGLA